jgi:hypothetical protein
MYLPYVDPEPANRPRGKRAFRLRNRGGLGLGLAVRAHGGRWGHARGVSLALLSL